MDRRRLTAVVLAIAFLLLAAGALAVGLGLTERGEYDWTTVTIVDDETGETLATVDARIADTHEKRYTGLSDTDSIDEDEGMLFVHDEPGTYSYVMRGMEFPIDIVFVDADGRITTIHHAPLEDGSIGQTRYTGTGQYVLEVTYQFTDRNGVDVGDRIEIGDRRENR